ncbi:MAG: hypothetical protein J6W84_08135 [Bacteroidales bacterium]|nr:hypothetical protein [Bacteroidales bacterium]
MKKIQTIFCTIFLLGSVVFGQNTFTYQAIIYDNNSNVVSNQNIGVRISFLEGSPTGTKVYTEQQKPQTTSYGLMEINIGDGGYNHSGNFSAIDWGKNIHMKIEFDITGGENYTISSVQPIQSIPVVSFANNANYAKTIDYNNIINPPHLFSGDYDSLTNKPVLFDGDYNSLQNKPDLFDGNYDSLTNKPNIYDTVSHVLRDSHYLRSYTETQQLGLLGDKLYITGGDTITINVTTGTGDYLTLNNLPNIDDSIRSVLADSNFITTVSEHQTLSISNDTISLTDGGHIILPKHEIDLTPYVKCKDTNQTINGTKQFTDSVLASNRFNKTTWKTEGSGNQAMTYGDMFLIADSLNRAMSPLSTKVNSPVVNSSPINVNVFPAMTSGGNVAMQGNANVTARGICYALHPTPTLADNFTTDGQGIGTFTSTVSPVLPDTTYYVRAYATNSYGTSYGIEVSALTPDTPTVETAAVSDVSFTTATVASIVTSYGRLNLTDKGICWSIYPSIPTIDSNFLSTGETYYDNYTQYITGLTDGTTYCVRAYATNNVGTGYGETITFTTTTASAPTVTTNIALGVLGDRARIQGTITSDGGLTITESGFCWGTSTNPTIANNHVVSYATLGSFEGLITGLSSNTTYYVRAYATNAKGTSYGTNLTITTTSTIDGTACTGSATVYDDNGNLYNTVKIGNQCWMKENLRSTYCNGNNAITVTSGTSTYTSTRYAYYPNSNSSNVAQYGYLYNWTAATGGVSSSTNPSGVRGACPYGWHVPSIAEFDQLVAYVQDYYSYPDTIVFYFWNSGDCYDCYQYTLNNTTYYVPYSDLSFDYEDYYDYNPDTGMDEWGYHYVGENQGCCARWPVLYHNAVRALAASGVWNGYNSDQDYYLHIETNHTNNASGFSAMPAGCKYSSSPSNFRYYAYFWTTNNYNSTSCYTKNISYSSYSGMSQSTANKGYAFSVRCLKD